MTRSSSRPGSPPCSQAADAAAAIRAWARMQAWRNPSFAAAARALDDTRHTDPAAAAAWADRTGNRMAGAIPSPSACAPKGGSTRPGQPPRRQRCCGS